MHDGLISGVVLGLVVAFVFAPVIRYVRRTGCSIRSAGDPLRRPGPGGLLFVPIAGAVARAPCGKPASGPVVGLLRGSGFDGLVLGFWRRCMATRVPRRPWLRRYCFGVRMDRRCAMLATRDRAAAAS